MLDAQHIFPLNIYIFFLIAQEVIRIQTYSNYYFFIDKTSLVVNFL